MPPPLKLMRIGALAIKTNVLSFVILFFLITLPTKRVPSAPLPIHEVKRGCQFGFDPLVKQKATVSV